MVDSSLMIYDTAQKPSVFVSVQKKIGTYLKGQNVFVSHAAFSGDKTERDRDKEERKMLHP